MAPHASSLVDLWSSHHHEERPQDESLVFPHNNDVVGRLNLQGLGHSKAVASFWAVSEDRAACTKSHGTWRADRQAGLCSRTVLNATFLGDLVQGSTTVGFQHTVTASAGRRVASFVEDETHARGAQTVDRNGVLREEKTVGGEAVVEAMQGPDGQQTGESVPANGAPKDPNSTMTWKQPPPTEEELQKIKAERELAEKHKEGEGVGREEGEGGRNAALIWGVAVPTVFMVGAGVFYNLFIKERPPILDLGGDSASEIIDSDMASMKSK